VGYKHQGDCYRSKNSMIQWMDEAIYPEIFNTAVKCKTLGIRYRLTNISDGKRLFVEEARCNELMGV